MVLWHSALQWYTSVMLLMWKVSKRGHSFNPQLAHSMESMPSSWAAHTDAMAKQGGQMLLSTQRLASSGQTKASGNLTLS